MVEQLVITYSIGLVIALLFNLKFNKFKSPVLYGAFLVLVFLYPLTVLIMNDLIREELEELYSYLLEIDENYDYVGHLIEEL